MSLSQKIDYAVIIKVEKANPNGDPLNGNRPRVDYENYGEITDVCLKRKIRDRLQEQGSSIFVQSDEKKIDGMPSLRKRAESEEYGVGKKILDAKQTPVDEARKAVCDKWFDVRAFGQVFAYKGEGKGKGKDKGEGISLPVRGPVTLQSAFSLQPVNITSTQITKSVNGEGDGSKKESDTMGMKHRVDEAVYVAYGAISPQLAERTGFSEDDAALLKKTLPILFEGDASSARPDGSMEVQAVIWWQHNSKSGQYSSAKVHASLKHYLEDLFSSDPENPEKKIAIELQALTEKVSDTFPDLKPEVIAGF